MVDDVPIAGDNAKSELRALAENIQLIKIHGGKDKSWGVAYSSPPTSRV